VDDALLAAGLQRLFAPPWDGGQRLAAAVAVLRRFAVIAGGPGTGKTTIVGRIVALLAEQAAGGGTAAPVVALAAPTGKAAARLQEAVHAEAAALPVGEEVRALLLALDGFTLHRLLGRGPGRGFRHHRGNRLPHDVIVVDETSMVSLWLMARLVEAVRPEARLILVGDPGQLTSIEAGAVLGDIVGPAARGLRMSATASRRLAAVAGVPVPATPGPEAGDGIVVLDGVHRYGEGIAALATALRRGDADGVVATLAAAPEGVTWIAEPDAERALEPIRAAAVAAGTDLVAAAEAGDAAAALARLGAFRLLCAHRRGAHGVATWTARIEAWLAAALDGFAAAGPWYPGRPLLVTENDYGLRLFNGDMGVVVATEPDRVRAVFERGGETHAVIRSRLEGVETAYAMTVHKSQGSQFGTAAVVLPPPGSRILTRELLYTAVTRARERLIIAGTEAAVRAAAGRPAARASGLRRRLWDVSDPG
jgi:exodeoxyribonuclease V alpha subunit